MSDTRILELIDELNRLVPLDDAQVILYDDCDELGVLPFCATKAGFLRFGLTFMQAAFAESEGIGANGGDRVDLDLDPIYRSDSNVEFVCERVEAIPLGGDRRRPTEVPGFVGLPLVAFVVVCFFVGLYHVCGMIRSNF